MYNFVTHTYNTIKGECYHNCSYCYMKRWKNQKPVRFDEKELKTDLGNGNFIFVGSSNDMFTNNIQRNWVLRTLEHLKKFNNKYLFQSKNPEGFLYMLENFVEFDKVFKNSVFCTTIESNRTYLNIYINSPLPINRAIYTGLIANIIPTYVTIEPILDFDLFELINLIVACKPVQVNIGADTGNNNLPEPSKEKILSLIAGLVNITKVKLKPNLERLLNK